MYLKYLHLTGFKAFADSTKLKFGPGITAIVGPNGSGKSNLVDAMLWVLGERGHHALRIGETADVIFSGSERRRALGLAEVSLTVDNSDGILPVDFAEVTVTRRAHRDGDSEYLLNKVPCRLRDIVELFLDTGVGAGTYSIIGQRDIDAVLSAKPEDRRELLEHAAGVQKYRFKRAEAKRKLDRTEVNLIRVRDLIYEIESQLAPLAEQAELARDYAERQARLRQLTLALLAREYDTRLKRLATLAEQRATVRHTLTNAQQKVIALEFEERELDGHLRRMEDSIAEIQRRTTELLTQVKSTEGRIAVSEERLRSLAEQREFLIQEIGILESRVIGLAQQQSTGQLEQSQCQQIVSEADAFTAAAEARFADATAALTETSRALELAKDSYLELMRRVADTRNLIAGCEARADNYRRRLEAMVRIQLSLTDEIRETEVLLAQTEQNLETTNRRRLQLDADLAAARATRTEQQAALARREQEWNATRRELSEVRSRLDTLRETQNRLEGFDRGVPAALEEVRQGRLAGPLQLLAELIRVPQAYERALEAALGDGLQVMITEDESTAREVFTWLRASAQGRVTVLPRNRISSSAVPGGGGTEPAGGPCQNIADLVECEPAHRDFVRALLGNAWVVEDDRSALQLRELQPYARVVTLEGTIYHADGRITGGEGQSGLGFIVRKREIEELQARALELEAAVAELEAQVGHASQAVATSEEEIRRCDAERVQALSAVAALEREVEHLRRQRERLQQQREQVAADEQDLAAEVAHEGEEGRQHQQHLEALNLECAQLDLTIAGHQHQVNEAARRRDQAAHQAAEIRVQQSAARERLVAMEKFLTELARQLEMTHQEMADKREAIARALDEDRELQTQIAGDQEALVDLRASYVEADQAFEGWRHERLSLVEQLEALGFQVRQERLQQHEAETEQHRLELRETQTRAEMEEMERRFREEFELTIEQALSHRDEIENKQAALEEQLTLRQQLSAMSHVNLGALAQQQALSERLTFLTQQRDDLAQGQVQLLEIIAEIDGRTREQFLSTFAAIQREFDYMFVRIFDGGSARLTLTDPENILESGVEIRVQLPGKAEQDLMVLSGGERALTALSLMLALLRVKPSPFCVLDEVDAPLDQSNVGRFAALLREFGARTQFIVITHNNGTMEAADVLYGVTMQEQGVSKLVSLKLVDAEPAAAGSATQRDPAPAL